MSYEAGGIRSGAIRRSLERLSTILQGDHLGALTEMQEFAFPASLAVGGGSVVNMNMAVVAGGDPIAEAVAVSGFGTSIAFKKRGLYAVEGTLVLASGVTGENGSGLMQAVTRAGGSPSASEIRGVPRANFPIYSNSYVRFSNIFEVRSTNIALAFSFIHSSAVSTWTAPGSVHIKRLIGGR